MPVYCEESVEATIRRVFPYAFMDGVTRSPHAGVPQLHFERIEPGAAFAVLGQTVLPIRLEHGRFRVLGFRLGNLAYCTDVNAIPEESWPMLAGLETLILDALRPAPHPTHFSLSEALAVVARLKPCAVFFTHLSHTLGHAATESALPAHVRLAYDGLSLSF